MSLPHWPVLPHLPGGPVTASSQPGTRLVSSKCDLPSPASPTRVTPLAALGGNSRVSTEGETEGWGGMRGGGPSTTLCMLRGGQSQPTHEVQRAPHATPLRGGHHHWVPPGSGPTAETTCIAVPSPPTPALLAGGLSLGAQSGTKASLSLASSPTGLTSASAPSVNTGCSPCSGAVRHTAAAQGEEGVTGLTPS